MAAFTEQVRRVVLPTVIVGLPNGELPEGVLRDVFAADGSRVGQLCEPAARAWQAMVTRAALDGIDLRPTSPIGAYRPLAEQVRLFEERYSVGGAGGGCRNCAGFGLRCKRSSSVETAACPGTSNHGRGLAVDVKHVRQGGRLAWLEANAETFGFRVELVPEEPWHVRYVTGDELPGAVLAHEAGLIEEDDMKATYVQHRGHSEVWLAGLGIEPRHVVLFGDAEFVAELTGVRVVAMPAPSPPDVVEVEDGAGTVRLISVVDDKGAKLYGLPSAD